MTSGTCTVSGLCVGIYYIMYVCVYVTVFTISLTMHELFDLTRMAAKIFSGHAFLLF